MSTVASDADGAVAIAAIAEHYARVHLRVGQDAEDVAQETVARCLRAGIEGPAPKIVAIAKRIVIDRFRQARTATRLGPSLARRESCVPSTIDVVMRREEQATADRVLGLIGSLSVRHRDSLGWSLDERPLVAVARELGLRAGTVRARALRARRALAQACAEAGIVGVTEAMEQDESP